MKAKPHSGSRRRFLANCVSLGVGSTLLPSTLWAKMAETDTTQATTAMVKAAAVIAGLNFSDEDCAAIVEAVNGNIGSIGHLHRLHIPYTISPPTYFSPMVEGIEVDRTRKPFRPSRRPTVSRPRNLEDVAFWPVTKLAELIRRRLVRSVELTEMYLHRLKRLNPKVNCVVTLLDESALAQSTKADTEIAAGHYRGPLHGIPWGAKDLIAVKGYPTTWGSEVYRGQYLDEDASVVTALNRSGAVLIAKLATGELAGAGDRWFGGRTNNPWRLSQGSTGSSAGSAAATAAGLLAFSIGTDTGGSIVSPAARCGVFGLRPTFGRVSCYGVMPRAWSADRVGPICRSTEDCALVMHIISGPDERDFSVPDVPFNWDAKLDVRRLKIGFVEEAFEDSNRPDEQIANEKKTLDTLRSKGVRLEPIKIPDFPLQTLRLGAETGAAFDEFLRSGKSSRLSFRYYGNDFRPSQLIPAVSHLQALRARKMMMQELAKATAGFDAYLAPSPVWDDLDSPNPVASTPDSPTQRHYSMANAAGYPALAAPNGFRVDGTPTSITFMARPYAEAKLLALAKSFQASTTFDQKHPML